VSPQYRQERLERRRGSLLLDEAREEDPSIGIIESHHEVLHRQPREPLVRRGIHVHQHPGHRPSLALATILPTATLCANVG